MPRSSFRNFLTIASLAALASVPALLRANDDHPDPAMPRQTIVISPDTAPSVIDRVPATSPASAPAAPLAPAHPGPAAKPKGPNISADARKLLDSVRDAYRALPALELAGTYSANFEVGDQKVDQSAPFTASWQAPNKFRHEMKDDILAGSSNGKAFAYKPSVNRYLSEDVTIAAPAAAPAELTRDLAKDPATAPATGPALAPATAPVPRLTLANLPASIAQIITVQNLSLALALSDDPATTLIANATDVSRAPDISLDQQGKNISCPVLLLKSPSGEHRIMIDPATYLLRRVDVDARPSLQKRGAADVHSALLRTDYTTVKIPTAGLPAAAFDWTPPTGATEERLAAGSGSDAAISMEGKPAPDFKLTGLEGREFQLKDQKGSVIVLDFFATWCGPCVGEIPSLDKLYREKKADGLQMYLVNMHEDPEIVRNFVNQQKLAIPVLMDTELSHVSDKYAVEGIPQTVVIGKDGVIRKVFVGADENSERDLRQAIDAALKAD